MRLVMKDPGVFRKALDASVSDDVKREIGAHLKAAARRSFTDQRRGPVMWPARGMPNIAGIVEDLKKGPNIQAKRFEDRPAGIDTGKLRSSIDYTISSDGVVVEATAPYADDFAEGGPRTIRLSKTVTGNLAIVMKQARGTMKRGIKKSPASERGQKKLGMAEGIAGLGWLFQAARKQGSIVINAQARPFLTIEDEDSIFITTAILKGMSRSKGD